MVKEPPPLACSSSRVTVDDIVIVAVVYRRVLNAGSSAAVGRILTIGGATVESTQNAPREIVTSVSTTRGDGRVLDQLLGFLPK